MNRETADLFIIELHVMGLNKNYTEINMRIRLKFPKLLGPSGYYYK